jgi:hypothetical protein
MRNLLCVLAVLACFGATPCAAREKITLYGGYCYFFPAASATSDALGSAWPQLTVGRLEKKKPDNWAATYDLASFRRNAHYDAMLIPVTVGVQRRLGPQRTDEIQPYLALRAGPYYGQVKPDGGDSDTRIGLNANAAVGVVIRERYLVEARYDHFGGRVGGFRLDGFSILAGVKLLDL